MQKKVRWYQVIGSVLAALFGVQTRHNHQRDFNQNSPWAYVVIGVFFTLLFVGTLWGIVQWVLTQASY